MKKLLTILLLFVMTVNISAPYYASTHEVTCMQEADEMKEKKGEEKHEKEYALNPDLQRPASVDSKIFDTSSCDPGLYPVLEHLTPPPDLGSVV